MSNAFTSALNRARDAFDKNLVRRGQSRYSRDSIESNDSPFGSSLATPIDADDRQNALYHDMSAQVNGVAMSLGSTIPDDLKVRSGSSSASMMDYFGFRNYNLKGGLPVLLSRTQTFQSSGTSAGSSPAGEVLSGYISRSLSEVFDDDAQASPGYSTPGSVEEESLTRKKSIYNLPNKPIVITAQKLKRSLSKGSLGSQIEAAGDLTRGTCASEAKHSLVTGTLVKCGDGPGLDYDFGDIENPDPFWFLRSVNWSPTAMATLVIRITCFVPWCVSVGGTMLLWPNQLELVAFQAGYVDSMYGIRRFAHWADVGIQLVMIFLAFVLCLLWFLPTLVGVLFVFSLVTRFVLVWKDVRIDYTVPLGEDDKQSLYLLAISGERGLMGETNSVTKTEAGFFVVPA